MYILVSINMSFYIHIFEKVIYYKANSTVVLIRRLYNVMKSYNQSGDGFNLIRTISYLAKVDFLLVIHHLIYLIFLVNLYNQTFESTFSIDGY